MKLLLVLLFSISTCFADYDISPMKQGDIAAKDGFFMTTETEKKVRQVKEEHKLYKQQNVKLKDLALIEEQRVETYKKRTEASEKQLRWEQTKGTFKGVGGFILGVAATSLAAYAAIRATK